jgi:hypothetical protein
MAANSDGSDLTQVLVNTHLNDTDNSSNVSDSILDVTDADKTIDDIYCPLPTPTKKAKWKLSELPRHSTEQQIEPEALPSNLDTFVNQLINRLKKKDQALWQDKWQSFKDGGWFY